VSVKINEQGDHRLARKRKYELKARADAQEATRRRITEATVALHQEVGPAKTTISEIAKRAGVQRLTVYNNFPDETSLLGACSAHYVAEHPPPDPASWAAVRDPARRTLAALAAVYAYYRETEPMTGKVMRDAQVMPALAAIVEAAYLPYMLAVRDDLAGAWERSRGGEPEARLRAVLGLAMRFETWSALAHDEGMTDEDAADLKVEMARASRRRGRPDRPATGV
jgi:AcrR family transcriptional regulator